ncbi:leucyl/phenylalanyl-tRNA--protein transferase [Kytococcus aerolatus]|uniref:Leucyl/phenylalanyl-tRNA--protein transferase n=1 Tax=Kytococcus aerolatus TaxID=592308 RepID=A0A212T406_9MICO|nr:leucyl/phenylalanyl-tRNA--protein transferase [Kytococcus aerolatus]SNC60772.1 leucyl/phenylalanyl-tRNA--protein transferase [Kytococcus aerolatus]
MRLTSEYDFAGLVATADPEQDLIGAGGDLAPGTLLSAYSHGVFPMGLGQHGRGPVGWWFPVERGVLLPDEVHVSRSLRRSMRGFTLTVDRCFDQVLRGCADPAREGAWITPRIRRAYGRLHRLGHAHSIEVWAGRPGEELAGGLYGVGLGGFFAGESMFHRRTDASKAAVVALSRVLGALGEEALVDVQWATPHLRTLGVRSIPRTEYLLRLRTARELPDPWRRASLILNNDVG